MHFERSPAYHLQVFADLLECRSILSAGRLRDHLDSRLDAMAVVACDLTHPDGNPGQFNDGGLPMARPAAECLALHERQGGRPPRPRPVFACKDAGLFGARRGRDLVLVDCGILAPDHLPAHGHGDALAFEWSLDGRRLVVDAGSSEYEPGATRAWERGTSAHNTVTVGDADQGEFWSSFRLGHRPRVRLEDFTALPTGFELRGSHDGFARQAGAPRHERRLHAEPHAIEVEDLVHGGDGQPVRARLLLHPEVEVTREEGAWRLSRETAHARLRCDHPLRIESAWWSPELGRRLPTRQLVLDYGPAPCRGGFSLRAASAHAHPSVPPAPTAGTETLGSRSASLELSP
jgi:uncharacterized heparinase superfamily protein